MGRGVCRPVLESLTLIHPPTRMRCHMRALPQAMREGMPEVVYKKAAT